MSSKKTQVLMDESAPIALDCELVGMINKIVWKNIHRGFMGVSWKIDEAGFQSRFSGYFGHHSEYSRIINALRIDDPNAKKMLFQKPKRRECDSLTDYSKRVDFCRLASKGKLVYVGELLEHDVSETPAYYTAYAIFRVPNTNKCIVAVLASDGKNFVRREK